MYSRRAFGKLTLSGLTAAAMPSAGQQRPPGGRIESTVRGVKLGVITAGFRGGGRAQGPGAGQGAPAADQARASVSPAAVGTDATDEVIADLLQVGAANVELSANLYGAPAQVGGAVGGQTPATQTPEYVESREQLRQWRLAGSLDRFREVRRKFADAGLNLFSYVVTVSDDFTDPEIEAVFKQMQALGVGIFCTNQTRVGMASRIVPFAARYKIRPAFHTHALVDDPNEVASPASLERILAMSPQMMVNLDIGHFTAGNQDAVAFLHQHHDRITHLHVKDRKRNNGPSVAWGTGDTPIDACLRLIRDNRWPIYCIIERDNRDEPGSAIELTRKYMDYMRRVLES